jgi:clan AA aspartic protease (TIGR02281 family)
MSRWTTRFCLAFLLFFGSSKTQTLAAPAQAAPAPPAPRYSDEVVAKADKVLADTGLKRSGKTIVSAASADLSRRFSALAPSRRALKLINDVWKQTAEQGKQLKRQAELTSAQNIPVNTQLAQAGLDVETRNRLVAMNNANVATLRQLALDQQRVQEKLSNDRNELNNAEAAYAESILALRKDFEALHKDLQNALEQKQVKLALMVCNTNFGTPLEPSADTILAPLSNRLKQAEQEIFRESIPLEVSPNGSLYVNVIIGDKTTRMVVDSGATVVSLPLEIARQIGVTVPAGAPEVKLELADGREIPGHLVKLPSIRVGQFEATDVDAAILDMVAAKAEPLLGMSYLSHFKFEINANEKSLKLLRVKAE